MNKTTPVSQRKPRFKYGKEALDMFNTVFDEDHYPNSTQREELAKHLGISQQRVYIWFQNKRAQCTDIKPKNRFQFSDEQLNKLNSVFESTKYPDLETRDALACEFGLSKERIYTWFQNKRANCPSTRIQLTEAATGRLNSVFETDQFPDLSTETLSNELVICLNRINKWFKNQRTNAKLSSSSGSSDTY